MNNKARFPGPVTLLTNKSNCSAHKYHRNWIISVNPCVSHNSLRPRSNRRHFADDIFKCIFQNENEWISPRISLKFVPKVRINNIPALVQIMASRLPGDKPLSEPMLVSLLTHICVTRLQWVNYWLQVGVRQVNKNSLSLGLGWDIGKGLMGYWRRVNRRDLHNLWPDTGQLFWKFSRHLKQATGLDA